MLACHKWLKPHARDAITPDHPRRVALEKALRAYKPKVKAGMRSVCVISTPFTVRKEIYKVSKSIVPYQGRTVKLCHVDCKALVSDYEQNNVDDTFEE